MSEALFVEGEDDGKTAGCAAGDFVSACEVAEGWEETQDEEGVEATQTTLAEANVVTAASVSECMPTPRSAAITFAGCRTPGHVPRLMQLGDMEPFTDRTSSSPPPRSWAHDAAVGPEASGQGVLSTSTTTTVCEPLAASPPTTPTSDNDVKPPWDILGLLFPLLSFQDRG